MNDLNHEYSANTNPMSTYIDGFVLPVPKDKIDDYQKAAALAGTVWLEHGALDYVEAVGDDLDVKDQTPFPKMAGAVESEIVVFAYIVYKSREHRDEVNTKVMADPRIKDMCESNSLGLDFTRMAYGGFRRIV